MSGHQPYNDRMPLAQARLQLTVLWFAGSGLVFGLLFIQSILGKYGEQLQAVWSWFVPMILPTLTLIIGVLGGTTTGAQDNTMVSRTFCRVSWWSSLVYLVALSGTILLEPLSNLGTKELLTYSNYWLGPIQGLSVAAIGFLFTSKKEATGAKKGINTDEENEESSGGER